MKIPQLFERKSNPSQQPRRCCHQHPDGTQCSANPQRGSEYCFFHDPAQEAQRRQASSAGGRASTHPPLLPPDLPILSLKTASDVASLLEETTNQVRRGEIELRAATTICYLANSLVHALDVASRAERQAAQEHQASRKKHPAPLKLTVYDHTGRIIDQIPPDPGFVPPSKQKQNLSPQTCPGEPWINADQRRFVQDPSAAPLLATGNWKLGTASSNTPTPSLSVEQGMSGPRGDADQRGSVQHPSDNALQQPGRSPDLRGSSTRASALAQNDTQKNLGGKPDPSAASLLATGNRQLGTDLRTAVQYPPGMGPRHLGPGPGGSLMAGTPLIPWWRRERINPMYITGTSARAAEMRAANARSRRTPR